MQPTPRRHNSHPSFGLPAGVMRQARALLAITLLVAFSTPALAHSESGIAGGFITGFTHPLRGADHMLAMVAVGLWGAILGRPLVALLPMIFPGVMAAGGALGMAGIPFPPVEYGIAASVLVLGAAIAFRWAAPVWTACLLVGIFGLFHGYAHGIELPSVVDPTAYSVGFVLATGLLHVVGILIGLMAMRPAGWAVVRALGALISACGIFFVGQALA